MKRAIEAITILFIAYNTIIVVNMFLCVQLFSNSYDRFESCTKGTIEYGMWDKYCQTIALDISNHYRMLTGFTYIPLVQESPNKFLDK